MENITNYPVVQIFACLAKMNCISELSVDDIQYNFKIMKENLKYKNILSKYNFDDNNICSKIYIEINELIDSEQVSYHKKRRTFFNNMRTDFANNLIKDLDKQTIKLMFDMINEYVSININKNSKKLVKA